MLLSNALKYAPHSQIDVTVDSDGELARLIVRDHGIGIPEAARARVLERFERAVPAENYGGFELGLYLSRQIVEAHGGSIEATETEGGGATMTVTFPSGLAAADSAHEPS